MFCDWHPFLIVQSMKILLYDHSNTTCTRMKIKSEVKNNNSKQQRENKQSERKKTASRSNTKTTTNKHCCCNLLVNVSQSICRVRIEKLTIRTIVARCINDEMIISIDQFLIQIIVVKRWGRVRIKSFSKIALLFLFNLPINNRIAVDYH